MDNRYQNRVEAFARWLASRLEDRRQDRQAANCYIDYMSKIGISRREAALGIAVLPLAACKPPRADPDIPFRPTQPEQSSSDPKPGDLVELTSINPTIQLDMRYATTNNFTGRILYDQPRAFMTRVAAEALVRAHRRAKTDGFGLTIFDAYRPWRVTKQLWDATPPGPQRNYVANPKRGSRHNRGCAVDLTLHRLVDGQQVEMPSPFDDFSARAHRKYDDDTATARRHAQLLESYMQANDFVGLSNEWWHFDFKDWADFPVMDIPFADIK